MIRQGGGEKTRRQDLNHYNVVKGGANRALLRGRARLAVQSNQHQKRIDDSRKVSQGTVTEEKKQNKNGEDLKPVRDKIS